MLGADAVLVENDADYETKVCVMWNFRFVLNSKRRRHPRADPGFSRRLPYTGERAVIASMMISIGAVSLPLVGGVVMAPGGTRVLARGLANLRAAGGAVLASVAPQRGWPAARQTLRAVRLVMAERPFSGQVQ
jgi:hypothetical protein